jgi:MFS transporter, SP family, sugar:H+ symporter
VKGASLTVPPSLDYWVKLFGTHVNAEGQTYITTGEQSLIVSLLSVGTFFGALSGAPIGDRIGRRWGLLGMNLASLQQETLD